MRRLFVYKNHWYCRWCGMEYIPDQESDRDGFCSTKHKQALHRAYKKHINWLLGKRGKRGKYKKRALPKSQRSGKPKSGTRQTRNAKKTKVSRKKKPSKPVRVKFYTKKDKVKNLFARIIVLGAVLFLCGCPDLRWNWSDNRKRIKPKLLDDEYRQTQEYKELRDIIIWKFGTDRYGDVYKRTAQDPILP